MIRCHAIASSTVLLFTFSDAACAQGLDGAAQGNSMTPLLIITCSVIGLVILFFGIASMVSSRRIKKKGISPAAPTDAVAAVASFEKARSVAKAADQAQKEI